MKILAVQLDIAWEDREANFAKVERMIAEARPEPNTLVVLPEMFATGFSMAPASVEPEDGPTDAFLARLAHQYDIALVGGAALRIGEESFNCALTFGPYATPWGTYRKQRPFVSGGEIYTPGKEPELIQMEGWDLAPLPSFCPFICYDLRFPEAFRVATVRGANLITVMASWPNARHHHWVKLLHARAIENEAYVVGVNRCGWDPKLE
ncbi:nitrilase-related carbon-nitrogen hydrolase, partial [Armatimonas sp.]|uniref:nitrilase-related carbon-nitrogen hydrolase n=1 Tax=Armatimonas sp. TaxID=1872638 RepID=UPI00374D3E75